MQTATLFRARDLPLTKRLPKTFWGNQKHPYRTFEAEVESRLRKDRFFSTRLRRSAEILAQLRPTIELAVSVDAVTFEAAERPRNLLLVNGDLNRLPLRDSSIDVTLARSVMEHLRQ